MCVYIFIHKYIILIYMDSVYHIQPKFPILTIKHIVYILQWPIQTVVSTHRNFSYELSHQSKSMKNRKNTCRADIKWYNN